MALKLPKKISKNVSKYDALSPGITAAVKSGERFFKGPDTSKEDARAQAEIEANKQIWQDLQTPEFQGVDYVSPDYVGDYTPSTSIQAPTVSVGQDISYQDLGDPELAALQELAGTSYEDISIDPRLKETQSDALTSLKGISDAGGMTAADVANLRRIQSETAQADRGRREAILQGMQQRGMAGSGRELLAQLQSSQAATDRASQEGLDIAGLAQQRALDAIMQSGQLAGSMRGQDYGEQAQLAAAKDAINKFNIANAADTSRFNVGNINQFRQAQAANQYQADVGNRAANIDVGTTNAQLGMQGQLANKSALDAARMQGQGMRQDVANMRAANVNRAQDVNKIDIPQQQFSNVVTKTQGITGAGQQAAANAEELARRKLERDAQIKSAILQAGVAGAGYAAGKGK